MSDRPSKSPKAGSPIAEAMQWVTRITTVALMTILPILGGRWLDGRLATSYWGVVGLVVGLAIGAWQMLLLAKSAGANASVVRKSGGSGRDAAGGGVAGGGASVRRSSSANPSSLSNETAEIAKRIDAALGKKNQSSDREP